MSKSPHVLIVEARFYDALSDALLTGARAALDAAGATHEVVTVPGALEVPATVSFADRGAADFDAYVALGVIIRGETYHFDIVANESARGLTDLSVQRGLAIGNGILTCENDAQAWERADPERLDKGGFAARAALRMAELRGTFGG